MSRSGVYTVPAGDPVLAGHCRCSHYAADGTRCVRPAVGVLNGPNGDRVPGVSCRECGEACVAEYAAKLGEAWTFLVAVGP